MQIRPKGGFERVVMIKEKFSFEPSNDVAPRSSFHFHMSLWKGLFCIPRRFPGFEKLAAGPPPLLLASLLELGRNGRSFAFRSRPVFTVRLWPCVAKIVVLHSASLFSCSFCRLVAASSVRISPRGRAAT